MSGMGSLVGIAAFGDPAAHEVLVEAVRPFPTGETPRIALGKPVAAAVRRMDLVGQHDAPSGSVPNSYLVSARISPRSPATWPDRARTAPARSPTLAPTGFWSAALDRRFRPAASGSSWPPSKALLVGVMIGCGKLFVVAQAVREPDAVHLPLALLYMVRTDVPWCRRDSRGRRSRPAGCRAVLPTTTLGSGYSRTWFGQMSAVFSNQKRAVCVSTCPLKGMQARCGRRR